VTSDHASGGPSRGADAPTRTSGTRDGIGAIVAILALGLVFRLIIARLNPGSGFKVDLIDFQFWAHELATHGLFGFYTRPFLHDYTPGYLYVLWLVGSIGNALNPSAGVGDLIKVPPILADVALGWLVWSMSRELGVGRRAALIGAALVVFNPVTWFDSVVWGQVDSFGVVFLLLGLRALWRDQPERSAVFTVIAALIKPQLAILVPIVAVVTIRRALRPPAPIDPEVTARGRGSLTAWLAPLLAWERRTDRPVRIVTTAVVAFLTAVALCLPFGLSVIDPPTVPGSLFSSGLVEQIFKTAGGYPYVSVNAYNPWALASVNGTGITANGVWACDTLILHPVDPQVLCTDAVTIAGIPAVIVGAILLAAAFVLVSLFVAWRPTPLTMLVGLTILTIAFFFLPTRVHERYLYPFLALGAILAAASIRWRVAYVVLSGTMFLNLYVVLTTLYGDNPHISDWLGIGPTIRKPEWVTAIALIGFAAALWSFTQLRRAARDALLDEIEASATDDEDADWADEALGEGRDDRPAGARWIGAAGSATSLTGWDPDSGGAVAAGSAGLAAVAVPTWSDPPSLAELGPIGWFRAKLAERPVRADRSRALHDEPGGRLDRLDLWILVVLVAAVLGVRMFRLSEPYQMHFDEVYHARTATEFLQDWRYGTSHDIYEWTHPHLAKYVMAGGLVAWGDDRVTATSDLGVPVVDATIEPRSDDPSLAGDRAGDRVDIVTGSELRSLDLATRDLVATIPIPGASAVADDPTGGRLFVGSRDGSISTVDTQALDAARRPGPSGPSATPSAPPEATAFAKVDGAIRRLFVPQDGSALIALTTDARAITLDAASGDVLGTVQLAGAGDIAAAGTAPALIATPDAVADPAAAAKAMASIFGGEASTYAERLRSVAVRTVLASIKDSDQRNRVQAAISDGRLAGLSIEDVPQVAIADAKGLEIIDPGTGGLTRTLDVGGPAHGLALTDVDSQKLYVATDPDPNAPGQKGRIAIVAVGGDVAKDGPVLLESMAMPGPVTQVAYDDQTEMVHVLGRTPDGSAPTIYAIEPHARAVYADARLPFQPAAWVMDAAHDYPTDDRQQILAFDGGGSVAAVDVGQHEFAWRLPGVLAGAAMAGFLYVLARILFRRRSVALIVGLISLVDGMFFVQSRIGMNDAYVGLAIVAAYTLFAALWMGAWKHRGAFWIAIPLIGLFLGLGLASKWVALYALGGIAILILARSALGRFVAIVSMIGLTAILGYLAINVPANSGLGNLPFVALMIALTIIAVVANVAHPMAWSLDEIRFAIGAPIVLGSAIALAAIATGTAFSQLAIGSIHVTPLEIAFAVAGMGVVAWALMAIGGRVGFGPLAPPPAPDDPAALLPPPSPPPAADWLRPGAQLGLPVIWMVACLFLLPVAIYVASYIPWALVENHRLFGTWPDGHGGQSLVDLTGAMYAYHNGLVAAHPASSPWWAWLFNFKPVWFYQEGLAGNTTAAIYDAGNLVAWWLGLPAMGFVAWQAFARRSLPLALVAIGFACQWVSWARIDRATFQYHYYTSLPFLFLALAYFLAELWHGASRRTWLLARVSAAVAVLGPALFWIFDRPLCGFVGVARANTGSAAQACQPTIPQFVLTAQTLALAVVVGLSVLVVLRQFGRLGAPGGRMGEAGAGEDATALVPLAVTAAAASLLTIAIRLFVPDVPLLSWNGIPVEPVAIILSIPAVGIAAFVATARDARRFVIGALVAMVGWFVVVYPNISALPLPTAIANVYQGVLPTYLYAFQFPVNNTAATVPIHLLGPVPLLLGGAMVFLCLVVGYSAWVWRLALAERAADDSGLGLGTGSGGTAIGD
jgi:C-terminal four TMM region of protein-O-mannosyltransferase/Dolichyl-phosphate-mannose-protein mannosyltransferase